VRRVNVDENRELAARYGVESIPCFVMLEHGREVDRVVGPTSVARLKLMYRKQGIRGQRSGAREGKFTIQTPESNIFPLLAPLSSLPSSGLAL